MTGAASSTYLLLGVHGDASARAWYLNGSFSFGNGFQDQAGQWLWADATAARSLSKSLRNLRVATTLNALNYTSPFRYSAYTAQLWPSLSKRAHSVTFTLTPQVTAGTWHADSVSGGIAVAGFEATIARTWGVTTVQLGAEAEHTASGALQGSFGGGSLDLSSTIKAFDVGGGVRSWKTPLKQEWGYSAFASRAIGSGLRLDVQLARSVTDPVLATPGSFGASVSFSWRVAAQSERTARPIAAVGLRTPRGRMVRFTIELPGATSAAVSGSFTDWNPITMQRSGQTFSVELLVPAGTYQYGFLIDGNTWYLPPDANGVVSDDFGRKNATLVVD